MKLKRFCLQMHLFFGLKIAILQMFFRRNSFRHHRSRRKYGCCFFFERRFLFKVKFEAPSIENSAKIWKEKLPILSSKESRTLAEKFQFSGGEMENIARKCAMQEIMQGDILNFTDIEGLCKNEKWSGEEKRKIGF